MQAKIPLKELLTGLVTGLRSIKDAGEAARDLGIDVRRACPLPAVGEVANCWVWAG